ncbi:MAG: ATP-binding cassette domain-containing protein [Clostridiales bacterium]|nr:ATP-binding cassette domain-containing protein [Clostridiales bacterium]
MADEALNDRALLRVEGLKQFFRAGRGRTVKAVNGVSFSIFPGETFCLVGESGSGKSTIARSVARLFEPSAGKIEFGGMDISGRLSAASRRALRAGMQMIFQDPLASLNPRKKVFDAIAYGLVELGLCASRAELSRRVFGIMEKVGLPPDFAGRYPHQFSGGQRQRIGIARALVMNPSLVIADEAISALDVSIQAQIVNLMKDLQRETGVAYLFIAHDLAMVKCISDRVGVLHNGYMVEIGFRDEIFGDPVHPYTRSLLSAIPVPNPIAERRRIVFSYSCAESGVDYGRGALRRLGGTHCVLAEDAELERWTQEPGL